MTKPIILLDCDQCVLDYNKRVGDIFKELFGYEPLVKNPKAYRKKIKPRPQFLFFE
jgi:hypothetical protein